MISRKYTLNRASKGNCVRKRNTHWRGNRVPPCCQKKKKKRNQKIIAYDIH